MSMAFFIKKKEGNCRKPEAVIPELKIGTQARIFSKLPLDQKIAAVVIKGAQLVGKAQARIAWERYKRGKKVDAWKKTASDKLRGRKRMR